MKSFKSPDTNLSSTTLRPPSDLQNCWSVTSVTVVRSVTCQEHCRDRGCRRRPCSPPWGWNIFLTSRAQQLPRASWQIKWVLEAESRLAAQPKHAAGCREIFLVGFLNQTKVKRGVDVQLMGNCHCEIFRAPSTMVVVLPFATLVCLLVWLPLSFLPRQWHYDLYINENTGVCCLHLPLPSVASASTLIPFPVLFVILTCSRDYPITSLIFIPILFAPLCSVRCCYYYLLA